MTLLNLNDLHLLTEHKVDYPLNFNEVLNASITKTSLIKIKVYRTKHRSQIWRKKWKSQVYKELKTYIPLELLKLRKT